MAKVIVKWEICIPETSLLKIERFRRDANNETMQHYSKQIMKAALLRIPTSSVKVFCSHTHYPKTKKILFSVR